MILVTGGTGLVGAHLLYDLIKAGKKVRAIHRSSSSFDTVKRIFNYYSEDSSNLFDKIDWVEADLLDIISLEDAFEGISHVYHCGALVSFNPKDKTQMDQININGTANIVNLILEKKHFETLPCKFYSGYR